MLSEGTYYWGHHGTKLVVQAELPSMGYTTVIPRNGEAEHVERPPLGAPRVDHIADEPLVLENEKLRAAFSPTTMQLLSLVSKASGRELMNAPGGDFCLAAEECSNEMTAWRVGRFARVYLKTPNAPGQQVFSRCAAPFFLEIRQYSCEKMSCSTQKFLAAGHIGSFQIHPKVVNLSMENPACVAKITRGVVHQSIQFALPFKSSMLTAEGSAVYAMKRAEDADGLVLRLFHPQKKAAPARLRFVRAVQRAELLAIPERPFGGALRTEADGVYVEMKPEEVVAHRVVF